MCWRWQQLWLTSGHWALVSGARPAVEETETETGPPPKPAAFSSSTASRELSFGSAPPEPAVSAGWGPPEPPAAVNSELSKSLFSFNTDTVGSRPSTVGTPVANLFGGNTPNTTAGGTPNLFGGSTAIPPSSTEGAPSVFGGGLAAAPSAFGGGASVTSITGSPATPQKDGAQVLPSGVKVLDVTSTEGVKGDEGSEEGHTEGVKESEGEEEDHTEGVKGDERSEGGHTEGVKVSEGGEKGGGRPVGKTGGVNASLLSVMLGADAEDETPAGVGPATDKSSEKLAPVSSSVASTAPVSTTSLFGQTSGSQFSFGGAPKTTPALFGASTTARPIFGGTPGTGTETDTQAGTSAKTVTTATPTGLFGQASGK